MCSFGMYWKVDKINKEHEIKEQIMEEILFKEVVINEEKPTIPEF